MEEPIGFVRDNPFVKNDTSRRFRRPVPCQSSSIAQQEKNTTHWRISPLLGSGVLKRSCQGSKEVNMKDTVDENNLDAVSIGSESDIEYGPGIVEKLKAKFHRLSGIVSREAKVSPHATGKRCPSMDDILTTSEEDSGIQQSSILEQNSSLPLSSLSRLHSKSTSDMLDAQDDRREFSVHRSLKIQPDDIVEIPSISFLRRKFEASVQRRPSQNIRCAKMSDVPRDLRIYPITVDPPHDQRAQMNRAIPPERCIIVEKPQSGIEPQSPKDQLVERCISSTNTNFEKTTHHSYVPIEKQRQVMFGDPKSTPQLRIFEAKRESTKSKVSNAYTPGRIIDDITDEEPEFVKIGRKLRKSSIHFQKEGDIDKEHRECNNDIVYIDERKQKPSEYVHMQERDEIPKGFLPRRDIELPELSCNTRIIRENTGRHICGVYCRDTSHRLREVLSPPDPDSARQRPSSLLQTTPTVFVRTDDLPDIADNSPPPEEPKPPQDLAEFVPVVNCPFSVSPVHRDIPSTVQVSPPLLNILKNDSGVSEVQQLLNRFQKNRGERQMEDYSVNTQPTGEPSHLVPTSPTQRPFMPAVVGVRSSDGALTCEVIRSTSHSVRVAPRPNVVSISVRDDAPSVIYTNQANYDDSAEISPASICTKRPAPLPPSDEEQIEPTSDKYIPCSVPKLVPPVLSQKLSHTQQTSPLESQSRISLSSKYLEEKSKNMVSPPREKPYGDDCTELKSELKESTADDTSNNLCTTVGTDSDVCSVTNETLRLSFMKDSETIASDSDEEDSSFSERPASIEFSQSPQLAGDGNPVRHSLISLVMEEDIPALMEAMSEQYAFEFVDLVESRPSSSSIIHSLETRKERRTSRQVDSIRFESSPPSVYTYLDEMSAINAQTWADGVQVDYDTYQALIAAETAEYEKNLAELEKWKNSISEQTKRVNVQPADDDFAMGVTSRFTYPIHGENSTISV